MIVRFKGKRWTLPDVIPFERTPHASGILNTHWYYNIIDYRKPKKGDWYLSGAEVIAYYAPNDLPGMDYLIAEQRVQAVKKSIWVEKE